MLVEFTPMEKRHFVTIFDDILTHEELRPNKEFRKVTKRYKNRFLGLNSMVNLKANEVGELYMLASSSLDVLNRTRKSSALPEENRQDVINYIVLVAGLVQKLHDIAVKSGKFVMNEPTKLPNEK